MKTSISVVINTLNEEKNLPSALRSVQPWADEIIVVDMQSEDRTVEIARSFGARVCLHPGPGFEYAPRAFALKQANSEWVMVLDADELIPVALSRDLKRLADSGEADVVLIPRINYLLGAPLRYSGWGPAQDHQMRFFRNGCVVGSSMAHGDFTAVEGARIKVLPFSGDNAIIHFNYVDSFHFIEKLNRYTSIEAKQAFERGEQITPLRAAVTGLREFLSRYLRAQGFRDGWRGFYLSVFMLFYRIAALAKLQELRTVGPRDAVEARYRQEAEKILEPYGKLDPPEAP
jgi:glycosyltransferase involved in cell wall biosynthesis